MFKDLFQAVKKKIEGARKAPSSVSVHKSEKEVEIKYKELTIFSVASAIIGLVLFIYWVSISIEFSIAPVISFDATLRRYTQDPFGIEVIYDIQWSSLEELGEVSEGDEVKISPTNQKCSAKSPCINMTVLKIYDDNQVFLGFKDNTLPITFTMEEFYNILKDSEKGRTSNRFTITGRLTENSFFIDNIEIAAKF